MHRPFSVILWFQLIPLLLAGQSLEDIPALQHSSYTVYDIEQGLPQSCISEVFMDQEGRLWLNQCTPETSEMFHSQRFYQYDGNRSHEISMVDPRDSTQYTYHIEGVTSKGQIFGVNREKSRCFVLDPDTRHQQFYAFGEEEVIFHLVTGGDGELHALSEKDSIRLIYEIKDGKKILLTSIPFYSESSAWKYTMVTPAVRSHQSIWLLEGNRGFIEYNLERDTFTRYIWRDLLDTSFSPIREPEEASNRIRLSVDHLGNPLFYLRELNRFYVFSIATGKLKRMERLDDFFMRTGEHDFEVPTFFKDERGNTLIRIIQLEQSSEGFAYSSPTVLLDNQGRLYDYTSVANLAKRGRYRNFAANHFYSRNFKRDVAIATNGGLVVADLKMDFSIQTFLKGRPARAMVEFSPQKYLVINELDQQVLISRDAQETDLWDIVTYPGSKDFMAGGSQLIHRGNDEIWFATTDGKLARYQKDDHTFSLFDVNRKFEKFNFVSDQEIALVDQEFGLYFYDLNQRKLRPCLSDDVPVHIEGTANELFVSRNGTLWIASLNGLWQVNYPEITVQRVGKEDGFKDDGVLCIQEASDGQLWLGTYSGGIHIYDPQVGLVKTIDESDGLSNNTVPGLLQDDMGNWWASTFDGITVLSEEGEVLFELSENDGISHREFNRFSYLKTSDGKLLFGTVDGVNLLDPEKIRSLYNTEEDLNIYLTSITYFNKRTGTDNRWTDPSAWSEQIIIPADKRYLEIDFALSNYHNPDRNNFLYRFFRPENASDTSEQQRWTSIGYNSELIITDLPTGEYSIGIKAVNYKGQWTGEPLSIQVFVQDYFYRRWWFYLLTISPLILIVWFWIRRLSTEKRRMEAEVEKRTQQIQRDKALIETQAIKLKELDELKSRFFTNISHEFRTPLTVISGMINQIEAQPERWMEKGIELIKRNSQQLLTLINQILDLRKLETGTLKANLIQADIIPFLQYLADSFMPMAQSKGIRIHFLAARSNLEMDYDPDKMLHIISNLLSNAIKYTPAPGDIYFQVDDRMVSGQKMLAIELRDTGKGISAEALPHIFDRFYQVEDLSSQKPQGSGVGLALTRELVQLLDGSIQVDSRPGVGSTFLLLFPIRNIAVHQDDRLHPYFTAKHEPGMPDESNSDKILKEPDMAQIAGLSTLSPANDASAENDLSQTLLIVEDNADVRVYLTSCLEQHYQLIYAENGQEGIDLAVEQVPDIILSDVMMPVKDGYALCDTLKQDERTSHIPIVMLTAKADFESRIKGLRLRADAYLSKPFKQEELLVTLDNLLEIRGRLQIKYAGLYLATEKSGDTTQPFTSDAEDAFLKKLRDIVVQHLDDADLSGEFICRKMNMSRTNIYRKLKALTDLSVSHFIRQVRLQKARELLLNTDKTIAEIAYETGFNDPKYFSRIFSETFDLSPSQFRSQ